MKKNLKIILSAVLLLAIVAGSSVLYQKLSADYVENGSQLVGSLITDRDALAAQLGQQNTVNNESTNRDDPTDAPQNSDTPITPPTSDNTDNGGNAEDSGEDISGNGNSGGSGSSDQPPSTESTEDSEESNDPPPPPKNLAPDFTVLDEDGNEVKLSDFRGKPVVLNFWATWCGYCIKEMPDFNTAYKKYPEIQFLMVNATATSGESEAKARKFKADNGYDFDIFFDTKRDAIDTYNITGYPTTFFISAEGELVASTRGMIKLSVLEQGIAVILPEKKKEL